MIKVIEMDPLLSQLLNLVYQESRDHVQAGIGLLAVLEQEGYVLMRKRLRPKVTPGWWLPKVGHIRPRHVLAISDTHVLYSDGKTQHECRLSTFDQWVRDAAASLGKPPEFTGLEMTQ